MNINQMLIKMKACLLGQSMAMCRLIALFLFSLLVLGHGSEEQHQPLSRIAIHRAKVSIDDSARIHASPKVLGHSGQNVAYVNVSFRNPKANATDWIGVFSPANISSAICTESDPMYIRSEGGPHLCTAPIKFRNAEYGENRIEGIATFRLVNQRAEFAFGLFTNDLDNPVLIAISNKISFAFPKAPAFPRLAQGHNWDEMTVTWTSGYSPQEAQPFVTWGLHGTEDSFHSPATTLSFTRNDMCGGTARTVGWRDPGYVHTSTLKDLWPGTKYYYKVGHKLKSGMVVLGKEIHFVSAPAPGEDSLQRVVIFGDLGKKERDGSNLYNDFQPGSLNTTDRLLEDVNNYDIAFHIGDIVYANGFLSQWDQFTEQIEGIAERVPYMLASGNHERDWPGSGSFYGNKDSGGECGVAVQTMFKMPLKNTAKYWYATDYGMFHFCVADTEQDWRQGTEQYKFLEECFASADRQKQPWLIFLAHRPLGYSSLDNFAKQGTFGEPMGRESLQKLWQKYKVDIGFYGHVHNYERTCPVYENICVSKEKDFYSGTYNATIHMVVGNAGASVATFSPVQTSWSVAQDVDYGFAKLTAFNHSMLLVEYKRSRDGQVHDKFVISREYRDVLGCDTLQNCPETTLAR